MIVSLQVQQGHIHAIVVRTEEINADECARGFIAMGIYSGDIFFIVELCEFRNQDSEDKD